MSLLIDFQNRALSDIDAVADYIRKDSPASALRFVRAVHGTAKKLLDYPFSGERYWPDHPKQGNIRLKPINGFENYLLIFRPTEHAIQIIRVIFGGRNLEALFSEDW